MRGAKQSLTQVRQLLCSGCGSIRADRTDDDDVGRNSWVSVLLHHGEKIPFPYLKAIYWVRVQGKSVWVSAWRTECFLWIMDFSLPTRVRNSILEGNDGISAALPWHGQTGRAAFPLPTRACWWTQSALIKDLSTLRIKTVECEEHIINGFGRVRMLSFSVALCLKKKKKKEILCSPFLICKVSIKRWIWKQESGHNFKWCTLKILGKVSLSHWQEVESSVSFSSYRYSSIRKDFLCSY